MAAICRLGFIRALTTQKIKCRTIATNARDCAIAKNETACENKPTVCEKKKPWVSYGFSEEDEVNDRRKMHEVFFVAITIGIVFTGFAQLFKPDTLSMTDWAQREAYLQLRYREEHGLPLIDPNYIDPAKIVLPTDEELGDTEIII